MGFIRAFAGGLTSSFANQWLEYMVPPANMTDHVAIAKAVPNKVAGSENNDGEENAGVISDGSKFLVPENTCLVVLENGAITAVIAEPGGYEYHAQNIPEAKSLFAKDGFFASTFGQSWNQFKFGGQPSNQQVAFYVNLRTMGGFPYGTQEPVPYLDANYNNLEMAVTSYGSYGIKIVDPVLFIKNFVPVDVVSGQGRSSFSLDVEDETNTKMLFDGFIGSFSNAMTKFCNGGKSYIDIKTDQDGFAGALNEVLEEKYQWGSKFGIQVCDVMVASVKRDEKSQADVDRFRTGVMMQGTVGTAYNQTQVAEGINAAGNNGGGAGIMGVGMGAGMMGMGFGTPAGVNPMPQAQPQQPQQPQQPAQPADPNAADGQTPAAE
ncbi:SPFH domain-containing protein [Candidatus Saccharibacteria bacterium]|nr:SPFH domain-containing protein [Candidatus Saccharibacteria bacterium]